MKTAGRPRWPMSAWRSRYGEAVSVMGPSGSGKSTLLNLIAGLDRPTSGSVRVGDERVDTLGETGAARFRRRRVGMIFQFFNLLDDMTVADNVLLPAQLSGQPKAQARERADELLTTLRIGPHQGRVPGAALWRGTAAGRDRARPGEPAGAAPRRRADRRARHRDRGGDRRVAARAELRRADAHPGHPQPGPGGQVRRPGHRARGRAGRRSDGASRDRSGRTGEARP